MENSTAKTVEILNSLVEVNNDRIQGYETAIREAKDSQLKVEFSLFIVTSKSCVTELCDEIKRLGGIPIELNKTSGEFFKLWMDLEKTISENLHRALLDSCVFREDITIGNYDDWLIEDVKNVVGERHTMMIRTQRTELHREREKLKTLREHICSRS
ncbi:PA2169 family four-helix-bundle protein [Flavobacterium lacus]|uniref:Uncharacterized protein (TIGR02284 family) n=1 Tax=Flavobacterium lacus TaxID=1353778 RepID=A0A328WMQ6_9FLAO|nr:PA2169 family four-helix-bundle protein [Flavobacterium lacus]RAR47590.1 uncharacterized protein (TIGR02284 family) [Flavobacterium lacus]